jgi:hypothetical protein
MKISSQYDWSKSNLAHFFKIRDKVMENLTKQKIKKIILPLSIPQNIMDIIEELQRSYQTKDYNGRNKYQLREELAKVAKRWHLYTGYESIAASYWICTSVGVTIYFTRNMEIGTYIQYHSSAGCLNHPKTEEECKASFPEKWTDPKTDITYKYKEKKWSI